MPEGPFGVPRLTALGPFTKLTAEELAIDTTDGRHLGTTSKRNYDNVPDVVKDNNEFGKYVENNFTEEIRDVYDTAKREHVEVSIVLCRDSTETGGPRIFTAGKNTGSTNMVEPPIASCAPEGLPIGSIHNHLADDGQDPPEQFDQVKKHHPSHGDLTSTLIEPPEGDPGKYNFTVAIKIIIGVNGESDRMVSVMSAYDDRVRQLVYIYSHPKLKVDGKARVYNELIVNELYEFKLEK
jgi:hypothetical protein